MADADIIVTATTPATTPCCLRPTVIRPGQHYQRHGLGPVEHKNEIDPACLWPRPIFTCPTGCSRQTRLLGELRTWRIAQRRRRMRRGSSRNLARHCPRARPRAGRRTRRSPFCRSDRHHWRWGQDTAIAANRPPDVRWPLDAGVDFSKLDLHPEGNTPHDVRASTQFQPGRIMPAATCENAQAMKAAEVDVIIGVRSFQHGLAHGYDGWSCHVHQCVVVGPDGDPVWFSAVGKGCQRRAHAPAWLSEEHDHRL